MSGREILQKVGHGMRQIWGDCWVFAWEREVVRVWAQAGYAVPILVDDVRYRNEVAKIKEMGGIVIRLERRPIEDVHESECDLDGFTGWDLVIPDGTEKEDACAMVLQACRDAGIV
jgi:hypothetical protein